ncbi:activating transcription factor 7-interacting protein 2-like isoform X2 [Adelges cooleyi]|uniref:activating transcription factor 7-interacting protein 2-like isoform X2 n=1 Tax=Adelges cooleyi TaxID=133065 RepID=UPI00217F76E5|nr:activating transcription factor 7-interacting protein 2-like isoform X2 [Adelges cooleyi]
MPSETAVQIVTQPIESTEKDKPLTNNVINNTTNEESKIPGVSKSEPKSSSNLKRSLEDKLTESDDGKKVRLFENSTDSKITEEISLNDNNDGENKITTIAPKSNMCNGAVTEEINNDKVSIVRDEINVNCDLQSEHEDVEDNDCNETNNGISSADNLLKKTMQSEDDVDSTNSDKSSIEREVSIENGDSVEEDLSKSPLSITESLGSTTSLSGNCEIIDTDETSKNENDSISISTEDSEMKDSDIEMQEEIVHKQNGNIQIKAKLKENGDFSKKSFSNNDDNKISTNNLLNIDETSSEKRLSSDDCEVVSTDSEIDQVNDGHPVEPILQGNRKLSKENFSKFLKLFNQNNFTFEQFESFCTQKIAENITEKNSLGKERSEIHLLMQREKIWRLRYESLVKQVKELKSIINKHKSDLKTDESARPLILNRTVGLQAILCVKEHTRLPKRLMSTQFDSNDVDIISDDDDVAVTLSDNPSIKTSSTPVKSPPVKPTTPVKDKSTQAVIKDVPPAVPLNSINNGTIDLTDNDDTPDITSRSFSEQQSIKIIRRPTVNSVLLPSSPTNMTRTITTQVSPKPVAYIGIPSTSNFLVQTSTAAPSQFTTVQHVTTTNSNSTNKNIKPFLFKDVAPVNSRSPTAVTLNTPRLQATPVARLQLGIPSNLQAVTPLRHPAPLPSIPNQRNLPSWKKLPPAPKLSITKGTENDPHPNGLVLSWNLVLNKSHAEITSYQIYAYQETVELPKFDLWKKIGEVNSLPLPMACSLTQFMQGQKYHFAVRAVDVYTRAGPFSVPQSVHLI